MKRLLKGLKPMRKKAIDTAKDPYLSDTKPPDGAVCSGCSAVWHGKHWALPELLTGEKKSALKRAELTLCPACKKTRDDFAEGFVEISGEFADKHRDEIMRLLRSKEGRAMRINPLERIIGIRRRNAMIEVRTTTEKLAQRIGRMLNKSLSGNVAYKWSRDTKVARVLWTRG